MTEYDRIPDDEKEYEEWEWDQAARMMAGEIPTVDPFHDGSLRLILSHAEEIVITACLLDVRYARKAISKLKPENFLPGVTNYRREIYRAILRVHINGYEINKLTVSEELSGNKNLVQRVLNLPYSQFLATKPDVDIYIRCIQERIRKKKLYDLSQQTSIQTKNGHTSKEIAEGLISRVNEITEDHDLNESADVDGMIHEHDEFVNLIASGEITPLTLPYIGLEAVVLYPGNQVVIGAYTSVGKSAFALNIAIDYARTGKSVLWVTTEMSRIEMIQRIASSLGGVGVGLMRQHNVRLDTHPAIKEWKRDVKESGGEFRIFYSSICNESNIQAELDSMRVRGGCDVLFIDYIQDIESVQRFREERLKIAHLTRWLRQQCADRGMVLFVLSQMSRPSRENRYKLRKPTVWDLKETGALENKTEIVILLHREDNTPNIREWNINVEVAKNRNGNRCEALYLFDSWKAQWK